MLSPDVDGSLTFSLKYTWDDGGLESAADASAASWFSDDQDDRYPDVTVEDFLGEGFWPGVVAAEMTTLGQIKLRF